MDPANLRQADNVVLFLLDAVLKFTLANVGEILQDMRDNIQSLNNNLRLLNDDLADLRTEVQIRRAESRNSLIVMNSRLRAAARATPLIKEVCKSLNSAVFSDQPMHACRSLAMGLVSHMPRRPV